MLQYIIQASTAAEIYEIAREAVYNGCSWLRFDFSQLSPDEAKKVIAGLKQEFEDTDGPIFTIEGNAALAKELNIGTILATVEPQEVKRARADLGEELIMGVTVGDASSVPFLPRTAIDYVEVADTGKAAEIVAAMRNMNYDEPVVARITNYEQLPETLAADVDGIALTHSSQETLQAIPGILDSLAGHIKRRLGDID